MAGIAAIELDQAQLDSAEVEPFRNLLAAIRLCRQQATGRNSSQPAKMTDTAEIGRS
jgi:hypothetical protein